MILRHTNGSQQAAVHMNISTRNFRRQPRRMQIKKDSVRIRDASGNILYTVFKIDGHARRIPIGRRTNPPHPRNLSRIRQAGRPSARVHTRARLHFFGGW